MELLYDSGEQSDSKKRIFSSNMEAYGLKKLAESLPLLFSLSLSCRAFLSHLHRASIRHLSSAPHLGCHVVRGILEHDKDSIILLYTLSFIVTLIDKDLPAYLSQI
jgi:hypothetical protein